ncbi:hypothetical protein MTO96_034170 [Rhipicephalus appendiculatus]
MTEKDTGMVCNVLDRMSEEEVQSLTEANVGWLPDMKSVTKIEAIASIRHALTSFSSAQRRLSAIARLYCYLAENGVLKRWWSYCFSLPSATSPDRFTIPDMLASLLKKESEGTLYEEVEREDALYACIMTSVSPPSYVDHNMLCLCIPRTLPYVFVHVLANKGGLLLLFPKSFPATHAGAAGWSTTWRAALRNREGPQEGGDVGTLTWD